MTHLLSLSRPITMLTAVAAGISLWSAPAVGQADFSVTALEAVQTIQTGSTSMTAGRSTMVRASLRQTGGVGNEVVDGLMRIFVGGVETADSPIFSDNGPLDVVSPVNKGIEDHTLNFIFLAPAGNVTYTVEVNPAGPNFVPESNLANNQRSLGPTNYVERNVPEMAYAPIDYRPSGGPTPNLPDNALIEPGVGDNFIQGIYPGKDWFYHRQDAPTKLWTSSLSGTGSNLLNSLATDINFMVPKPDFLYGWVPGSLPYNGQAFISGEVSMGNTQPIRHQRTFAHEVGHNTGLQHNNTTVFLFGVDVEHHLAITENLSKIKPTTQKDIMAAGLLTQAAWVASPSYESWMIDPEWAPTSLAPATLTLDEGLFIAGTWNRLTGAIEFTDVLTMPNVEPTTVDPNVPAELVLRTLSAGDVMTSLPITTVTSADCVVCSPEQLDENGSDAVSTPDPIIGFMAIVPTTVEGRTIDGFEIDRTGSARVLPRRVERSSSQPEAAVSVETVGTTATISWEGLDADGDDLRYYLRYSSDGEKFTPVMSGASVTEWRVDISKLARPVAGQAFFELFVTDGLNTTTVRTDPLPSFAGGGGGNDPWVEILTPDNNLSYLRGATVVLHSSGWDIEDRGLSGSSIQWTSNVDGAIGSGRVTATTTLSPGAHVLTVTATDSDGNTTIDTADVTIIDRGLPDVGEVCQTDLGFGGPGVAELMLCGGNLSAGTFAELTLTDAAPNAMAFLVVGLSNNPTPTKGGMLVPVPVLSISNVTTDGNGALTIPNIAGGAGPLTAYVQVAIIDGSQQFGFDFSNALEVVLP